MPTVIGQSIINLVLVSRRSIDATANFSFCFLTLLLQFWFVVSLNLYFQVAFSLPSSLSLLKFPTISDPGNASMLNAEISALDYLEAWPNPLPYTNYMNNVAVVQ